MTTETGLKALILLGDGGSVNKPVEVRPTRKNVKEIRILLSSSDLVKFKLG